MIIVPSFLTAVLKRDRLWKVGQYRCIDSLRFIHMDEITSGSYPEALQRLKADGSTDTLLDLACCVGQVIRMLAADGADSSRLYGVDLHPEFIDIGYDLFNDRDRLKAKFFSGDIFKAGDPGFSALEGKANIIHTRAFLHLFDWKGQVEIGIRITRLLAPGASNAMIFGKQMGSSQPGEVHNHRGGTRYVHDPDSFQRLWDEVGAKTGTKWKVEATLEPRTRATPTKEEETARRSLGGLSFTVYKI